MSAEECRTVCANIFVEASNPPRGGAENRQTAQTRQENLGFPTIIDFSGALIPRPYLFLSLTLGSAV